MPTHPASLRAPGERAGDTRDDRARGEGRARSFLVPMLAVSAAAFSFAFQETGILPSLTEIRRTLPGTTTSTVTFPESGYLVVAAVSSTALGKIGDRRGKKPVILVSMGCYMVGAIGAAFAPDLTALVVFRAPAVRHRRRPRTVRRGAGGVRTVGGPDHLTPGPGGSGARGEVVVWPRGPGRSAGCAPSPPLHSPR